MTCMGITVSRSELSGIRRDFDLVHKSQIATKLERMFQTVPKYSKIVYGS